MTANFKCVCGGPGTRSLNQNNCHSFPFENTVLHSLWRHRYKYHKLYYYLIEWIDCWPTYRTSQLIYEKSWKMTTYDNFLDFLLCEMVIICTPICLSQPERWTIDHTPVMVCWSMAEWGRVEPQRRAGGGRPLLGWGYYSLAGTTASALAVQSLQSCKVCHPVTIQPAVGKLLSAQC